MGEETAREYIAFAEQLISDGYYNKAFEVYLVAFEKHPQLKEVYEVDFRVTVEILNDALINAGKIKEAFNNFNKAIAAYPESKFLINDTGKYLYQFGFYMEAWCHFQKALKMDSGFVDAEKNLNSIKNYLVERWHYRMLNDSIRNEAYHDAIKQTLIPHKDTILDMGSGTGLLSLYCMEKEPIALTACDSNIQMVKMSEYIFEDNNYAEIIIINNMSTDMTFKDIAGKRSLLVTELFDAGLFGEHILQSLNHAHEKLLSNVGRVLPNKAEFFIIGAKCDHLNYKSQLSPAAKAILNVPLLYVHCIIDDETYDCEDVYQFKDLKYMTEPQSVLKIDFNDVDDIREKLNREKPYEVKLRAIETGEINNIIGYFNLYLTDKVTVTTDPRSDKMANAWQQAVFYDYVPETVQKNCTINMNILLKDDKLSLVSKKDNIIRISAEILRFLNDSEYVKMIMKCLGMASIYLGQTTEMSQIKIMDFCPFPLFGLKMLKRGAKFLACFVKTPTDKKFLRKVLKANNISLSKVHIVVGDDFTKDSFIGEKFHAIICNPFELVGEIDLHLYKLYEHFKNAHLHRGGLFMPASISLVAQVVISHWLDINNRVYDKNTSGYEIGKYINKYQVSQNYCIDFACLDYTALTEPIFMGKFGQEVSGIVNVPVVKSGEANAILCWYNIELMENLGEFATNRGNSFIDGIVFLANPAVRMEAGLTANVLRCIDADGAFKFVIDGEAT